MENEELNQYFMEGPKNGSAGQDRYPESALDFHLTINEVAASKVVDDEGKLRFKDFTRDYSNSNLDRFELHQLRQLNMLFEICKEIGAKESAWWVQRKINAILNTSRAKNGFERRMTVSQFNSSQVKHDQTFKEGGSSKFLLFGKKKSRPAPGGFQQYGEGGY